MGCRYVDVEDPSAAEFPGTLQRIQDWIIEVPVILVDGEVQYWGDFSLTEVWDLLDYMVETMTSGSG